MKTKKDVLIRYVGDVRDFTVMIDIIKTCLGTIGNLANDADVSKQLRTVYWQIRARAWELRDTNQAIRRCLRPGNPQYDTTTDNDYHLRLILSEIDAAIGPVVPKNGIYDMTLTAEQLAAL